MSNLKNLLWMVFVLLGAVHASAQTINKLSITTVPSSAGKVIQVPIQLENTDEIVAIQFDINIQDEISILDEVLSSDRWEDHVGVVKNLGNGRSRVMVYSSTNKPLRGNSGNVLMLKAYISESCVEGEEYAAELHDVTLTKSNGDNCVTATQNGKFIILKSPDLMPEFISCGKSVVSPLDSINCSWKVRNIGGVPTTGGFKEQVFAVSEDGKNQIMIGTQYSANPIPSQGESQRSMNVIIPKIPSIDGNSLLMIKIIPDSDCGEPQSMTGNNSCKSDKQIDFLKCLYLEDIKAHVDERESGTLKYKLSRSGSTVKDEIFTLNIVGSDSRAVFPTTVMIPRNQSSTYFYVTIVANGKIDESDHIEFSISGNGYPEISSILSITDDTFPQLKLTLSKDEVTEGDTFDLTIEMPKSFTFDKTIYLSSDNSAKIKIPTDVTIPAGQTSLTIPLSVIDNEDAELGTAVTITATAEGLEGDDCEVEVLDNDMPTLSLTLSPSEISENAGNSAVIATVKRLSNIDKSVKLLLMEDSDGAIELSHKTISMSKGQENVQFLVNIKDNDLVDGNKHYTITVAVYSSACDCYASELSGGAISKELVVLDDDGPSLSILVTAQSFLEGTSDNIITISRNTSPESDIMVNLNSDKDELLDYNHNVIIPAGSMSVDVNISVLSNEEYGADDIVSFKAESTGMTSCTCWVVLTDQTLPDATIELQAAQDSPLAGDCIDLILTVSNIGNSSLQRNTPIDIKCTGIKDTKRVYTKKVIEKGESDRLVVEDFQLPELTGLVNISAVINNDETVTELLYSNNSAKPVKLNLAPAFSVTASVDKDIYVQEEDVVITGHASGESGKNAKIEIHLSDNGSSQILNTTTDDNGDYSYTYKLLPRQTGHFTVSACYPTFIPEAQSAMFDVYGLQTNKTFITCEPGLGETINGSFKISNPGILSQNSLTIETISNPTNCELHIDSPTVIGAGETVDVKFSLKGTNLSSGKDFEKIPLNITTAEGAKVIFIIYYYVQSLYGKLYTSTPTISTTMQKDTPRVYPVVIRNIGKGETGKITFAFPSWVETVTPREMASLGAGDSATVVLRFNPTDEMELNVATRGKLGVNCENGDGISVSFDIMPVSEAIGKIKVDVVDEFTFFTSEAPHVSNAKIKITHPTSKAVIAEGTTDYNGIFTAEIQEGWYVMSVEADNHDIYTENIIISPGTELSKEVFMPYQAITYNWTVEETEIDDEYVFETTVDFDTRVPKPIVVISLPDEKPEPYSVIPVKITNKGLINAINIEMSLEVSEGYTLEFLNDPTAEVLAPQQTLLFYAKLIPTETASEVRSKAPRAGRECIWIISKAKYQELCQKYTGDQFVQMLKKYGKESCFNTGNGYGGTGGASGAGNGVSGGGPGRPGTWGGGTSYDSDYYIIDWSNPEKYCDRKSGSNPLDKDDNDPIDLPKVGEGNPDELPCDSKEEPKLVYKLVPINGARYEMNGVAADGVSQVKIVLDPEKSCIPSQDCDKFYGFSWLLLKNGEVVEEDTHFGSIERISDWEAIYTAPSCFPEECVSTTTVEAQLWYRHKDPTLPDEYDGWLKEAPRVKIEIVRPPVVFIHGLGDNRSCWYDTEMSLIEQGYYKRYYNYRVDYRESNASTFMSNVGVVSDGIYTARKKAAKLGYIATKCDLVGHSMGGILARLFVERSGKTENINRIITVNTPHAGSELGDMVSAHDVVLKKAAQLFYGKDDIDAVKDLAVESDEMNLLVSDHGHWDIPCYAIGTQSDLRGIILNGGATAITGLSGTAFATTLAGAIADPEPMTKTLLTVVSLACGEIALEGRHLLDDYAQVGEGDLVVSSESQIGGCEAFELIEHGPWHCNSPKDFKVINRITELLKKSSSDTIFSSKWFNPKKRNFNHPNGWELWGQRILNVLTNSYPSSIWGDLISVAASEWGFLANVDFTISLSTNNIPKSRAINSKSTSYIQERLLKIDLILPEELTHTISCIYLNDHLAYILSGEDNQFTIPSTFSGDVSVKIFLKDTHDNLFYDERVINIEAPLAIPVSVDGDNVDIIEGKDTYLSIECVWDNGTKTFVKADNVLVEDSSIAKYSDGILRGLKAGKTHATITYAGLSCNTEVVVYPSNIVDDDDSDAICSTVTLSFKQSAVMTRQAFRGIFSLNNGHQTATLKDFKLNLEVKDENGVVATRREFEITPEKLAGFQGSLDLNSGWSLEPSHNGEASILFIPTKYAAPNEPKEYSFGGTFSYIDPYTGLTVTRTLNPVTLTVNPSPQLELTYFMQRDVFGDNPLTEEIEPMKPAEFALLLNNVGAGDATSLKLTTGQPQIVSNEKGLYINFELLSTQLNGGEHSLMLGGNAVTDFGSLKSGEQSYAQWWLQSSLLGHFVKYDVKSTHVTSYDNPDLSLVDTVSVHELIHGFDIRVGDDKNRAFLVNDIVDVLDTPDQLYFTDGSQADVVLYREASVSKQNDLEYILNVSASTPGWNYGAITDPTHGRQILSSIKRMSDGAELAVDNFWQTDFTLRDGKDPLAENLLHFVDNFLDGNESYKLTFMPKPDIELAVDSIIGLPTEDEILTDQLTTVTVKFNKPIDPISFTIEDLSLTCQGERINLPAVTITPITDVDYMIDLTSATIDNGFYVLQIQTSTISDTEGFAGSVGKAVSWIQYIDGKVRVTTSFTPSEGGSVTPQTGLYDYASEVTLNAIPAEGYNFLGWWCDDDMISEVPVTQVAVTEDKNYLARFALKQFNFATGCNGEGGYVAGSSTGIYDFGQILRLEAIPYYGWSFSHWTVDGSEISDGSNNLELTITHDTEIFATFVCHIEEHTYQLQYGWNWISSIFDDQSLYEPSQFFKSIKSSLLEVKAPNGNLILNDGLFENSFDRMEPGTYKVHVKNSTSLRLKGATVPKDDYEVGLSNGWNWLPYVPNTEQNISDALVNHSPKENDVIKSHIQFSIYSDGKWWGSLQTFLPDQGYMYYTSEPSSFKYSTNSVPSITAINDNTSLWQYNERGFADNKSIVAKIFYNEGPVAEEDYIIGAFCNDECRGIGECINGHVFITVHGQEGDSISFKAMDNRLGVERDIEESLIFDENHLGSLTDPFRLTLDESNGINDVLVGYGLNVSPNPVKDIMYINGDVSNVKSVNVIALSGITLISTDSFEHGINVTSIPDGVYVAAILTTQGVAYRKFIKKGY